MKALLLAATAALSLAGAANAQNYGGGYADPQVVSMINALLAISQQQCQMGNAQACAGLPQAQQEANTILMAGQDCAMGNPQACNFYYSSVQMMQQTLYQVQMPAPAPGYGTGYATGTTGFTPSAPTGTTGGYTMDDYQHDSFINSTIWERDQTGWTVEDGTVTGSTWSD